MKTLTPKQRSFVAEYLKDCNGTQAAIRAGYSKKTAQVQSARLLSKAMVRAAVDGALLQAQEKAVVDKAFFLATLREVIDRGLQAKPVMVFDHEEKQMVQKRDPETGEGVWECDLAAVNGANRMVGQHLKLLTDRLEVEGLDNLADRIKNARERKNAGH